MKSFWGIVFIVSLMLLAGCGSQDRYEVMPANSNYIIEEQAWGTVTGVTTVHNNFNPSPAAVVDGRFYFGSRGGMVYAVTPTGFETLPRPNDLFVRDLIAGPDGLLWMTDYNGRVLSFQDGRWELDQDLDLDWDTGTRLLLDHENRLLLMGDHEDEYYKGNTRGLWRRDGTGQWSQQDLPGDPDIMHGWCEYGQPPVFLTRHLELITETPDGWQVSDPVWPDVNNNGVELQCSEDGKMAIRMPGDYGFLLNNGRSWQLMATDIVLEHLFWFENQLFGLPRYLDQLLRWDGEAWAFFQNTIPDYHNTGAWSLADGSRRILYCSQGGSMIFDGMELVENTAPLGYPQTVVRYGGMDHLYMYHGLHVMGTEGQWEVVGDPFGSSDRSSINKRMLVDDQDHLVFWSGNKLAVWEGESYRIITFDQSLTGYLQPDGTIVFLSYDQVGVWTQGQLNWVGFHDESQWSVIGAQWLSPEKIQLLTRTHLRVVEPEQNAITLTFQGWTPRVCASGESGRLAVGGVERLVVIEDGEILDITPTWGTTQGEAARINTLISDGLGGWVVFDYDHSTLLRYDGGNWFDMGVNFRTIIYDSGTLTSNGDGSFMLQDYGYVFLVDPEAAP